MIEKLKSKAYGSILNLGYLFAQNPGERMIFGWAPLLTKSLVDHDQFTAGLEPLLLSGWGIDPAFPKIGSDRSTTRFPRSEDNGTDAYKQAKECLHDIFYSDWRKTEHSPNGQIPEAFQFTAEQKNAIMFLGLASEDEFLDKVPKSILQMVNKIDFAPDSAKNILAQIRVKRSINDSIDFAIKAFALVEEQTKSNGQKQGKRKSGESLVCHSLRVLHYLLSHLEHEGKLPVTERDWIDLCNVALFHDVLEDLNDVELKPFDEPPLSVYRSAWSVDENKKQYVLNHKDMRKEGVKLSGRAVHAIQALTYQETKVDRGKIEHVGSASQWEMTELVKSCDKLDNDLTYPLAAAKNWSGMTYKMFEGVAGTGHLLWKGLLNTASKDGLHQVEDLLRRANSDSIKKTFPELLCCVGLYQYCQNSIHSEWMNRMKAEYGYDLTMDKENKMKHGLPSSYTDDDQQMWLDLDQVSEMLDIRNILTQATQRVQNGGNDLFGMSDIARYNNRVWEIMSEYTGAGLSQTGHGKYPFLRPRTRDDQKFDSIIKQALFYRAGGMIYTALGGSTLLSAVVYSALSEPRDNDVFKSIINSALILSASGATALSVEELMKFKARRLRRRQNATIYKSRDTTTS